MVHMNILIDLVLEVLAHAAAGQVEVEQKN